MGKYCRAAACFMDFNVAGRKLQVHGHLNRVGHTIAGMIYGRYNDISLIYS